MTNYKGSVLWLHDTVLELHLDLHHRQAKDLEAGDSKAKKKDRKSLQKSQIGVPTTKENKPPNVVPFDPPEDEEKLANSARSSSTSTPSNANNRGRRVRNSLDNSFSSLSSSTSSTLSTPASSTGKLRRSSYREDDSAEESDTTADPDEDIEYISEELNEEDEEELEEMLAAVSNFNPSDRDKTISDLVSKLSLYESKMKQLKQSVAVLKKEQMKTAKQQSTKFTEKKGKRGSISLTKPKGKALKKGGKKTKGKGMRDSGLDDDITPQPSASLKRSPSYQDWELDIDVEGTLKLMQLEASGNVSPLELINGKVVVANDEPTTPQASEMSRSRSFSTFSPLLTPREVKRSSHNRNPSEGDELFLQMFNKTLYTDINTLDSSQRAPLHSCVTAGHIKQVRELLHNGANVNILDGSHNTPLHLAFYNNRPDIIELLLDYEANVHMRDKDNNTPLLLACSRNYLDIADKLIQIGADVNQCSNSSGNSPLMLACHNKCVDLASILIARGSDVNHRNKYGDTCVLWCSAAGHCELVVLLVERGADVNVKDRNGNTPLHKAASGGHRDIVEILIEKGADLRVVNDNGQKPLDVSATPQIRKILEDYDPGVKSWKWETDLDALRIDKEPIGEGKFSIVYKGKLYGTPVAVKVLKVNHLTEPVIQSFNHEVGLMSDIKHPNVLLFLGACNASSHLSIITEYLPIGSLRRYLDRDTIRWSQVLKFAVSTARGMAWLHSRSPVVLHRDLHSNNILVTENLECKVADLGLSQIQGQKYLSSTIYKRIVPPEILKGQIFTKHSDVFSYGLILYELLTTKKADHTAIKQISNLEQYHFGEEAQSGKDIYIDLIKACTHQIPEKRPLFEDILTCLEALQEKDSCYKREVQLQAKPDVLTTTVLQSGEYVE